MKYLMRLDDACETMNLEKWFRIENLFYKYNIKPLISVIPNNEDESQIINNKYEDFWDWLHQLDKKNWEIALHGNNHVYQTNNGGINPIHQRSEFAGLSLEIQKNKIKAGFSKLIQKGFKPRIFVAPSHTFDLNTLKALKHESSIRIISDTISFFPYKKHDFIFIPQQLGSVRTIYLPGLYTFCYHPNTMSEQSFLDLEKFLSKNSKKFIGFKELNIENVSNKSIFDNLLSFLYFQFRKIFRK